MHLPPTLIRPLRTVLLGLLVVALPSCDILDPADDEPPVGLEALDRLWTRTQSSNSSNDGMKVRIETNTATVLVPSGSDYPIGETLWRDIRHQGDNEFTLQVLGSDGEYYEATLGLNENLTRATMDIALGTSGSQQTWEAYPDPEGDELDRIERTWTRTSSTDSSNDGMRLAVSGSQGTLTFVPSTSFGFQVDDVLWRDITPISIVEYSLEILGSDGNYYPALIERVGPSRLELYVVAFSGPRQVWED